MYMALCECTSYAYSTRTVSECERHRYRWIKFVKHVDSQPSDVHAEEAWACAFECWIEGACKWCCCLYLILALMPQTKRDEVAGPAKQLGVVAALDAAAHVRQVEHARVERVGLLQPPHEVELQSEPAQQQHTNM